MVERHDNGWIDRWNELAINLSDSSVYGNVEITLVKEDEGYTCYVGVNTFNPVYDGFMLRVNDDNPRQTVKVHFIRR